MAEDEDAHDATHRCSKVTQLLLVGIGPRGKVIAAAAAARTTRTAPAFGGGARARQRTPRRHVVVGVKFAKMVELVANNAETERWATRFSKEETRKDG